MATVVELPRLSDTMEEGVVARWLIKEGDKVKRGQVIAEIETDKATMEFESFDGGTVLRLLAKEGETLALGAPIAVLGQPGEDPSAALAGKGASAPTPAAKNAPPAPAAAAEATAVSLTQGAAAPPQAAAPPHAAAQAAAPVERPNDGRVPASPLARRLAREHGIALVDVDGTGPHGRVIKADIDRAAASGPRTASPGTLAATADAAGRPFLTRPDVRHPLTQMRKTIVKRMTQSKREAPHFYLTIDVDMQAATEVRAQLNASLPETKISFNDMVIAAAARALRDYPRANSTYTDEGIIEHGDVHVGMAVALDDGLIVPVLRHADQKSVRAISLETRLLGGKAKDKALHPDDMKGSTFTVSNLGMFGIEEFAAVVNPGEGAILAVGAVRDAVVAHQSGPAVRKRMKCTLSCDHRVVDGAVGARFLQVFTGYLEQPLRLLVD